MFDRKATSRDIQEQLAISCGLTRQIYRQIDRYSGTTSYLLWTHQLDRYSGTTSYRLWTYQVNRLIDRQIFRNNLLSPVDSVDIQIDIQEQLARQIDRYIDIQEQLAISCGLRRYISRYSGTTSYFLWTHQVDRQIDIQEQLAISYGLTRQIDRQTFRDNQLFLLDSLGRQILRKNKLSPLDSLSR